MQKYGGDFEDIKKYMDTENLDTVKDYVNQLKKKFNP